MVCKRAEYCMHGVICFILIDLIMQHDYFQKRKQLNLLSVSVRVKHLLIFYCTLLLFDMQHDHILKKLILFLHGGFLAPGAEFKKIYISYLELWRPFCSAEWNHLCNFGRRHHEEQFCEIILNLDRCFRKKCHLKIFLIWRPGGPFYSGVEPYVKNW